MEERVERDRDRVSMCGVSACVAERRAAARESLHRRTEGDWSSRPARQGSSKALGKGREGRGRGSASGNYVQYGKGQLGQIGGG